MNFYFNYLGCRETHQNMSSPSVKITARVTGGDAYSVSICVANHPIEVAAEDGNIFTLPNDERVVIFASVWDSDWGKLIGSTKILETKQLSGVRTHKDSVGQDGKTIITITWEYLNGAGKLPAAIPDKRDIRRCSCRPRVYIGSGTLYCTLQLQDESNRDVHKIEIQSGGRSQVIDTTQGRREKIKFQTCTNEDFIVLNLIRPGSEPSPALLLKARDGVAQQYSLGSKPSLVWKASEPTASATWPSPDVLLTLGISFVVTTTTSSQSYIPSNSVRIIQGRMPVTGVPNAPSTLFAVSDVETHQKTLGVATYWPYWNELLSTQKGTLSVLRDGQLLGSIRLPSGTGEGWLADSAFDVQNGGWPKFEIYCRWKLDSNTDNTTDGIGRLKKIQPTTLTLLAVRAKKLLAADNNPPQSVVAGLVGEGNDVIRLDPTHPDKDNVWSWNLTQKATPISMQLTDPRSTIALTMMEEIDGLKLGTTFLNLNPAQVQDALSGELRIPLKLSSEAGTDAGVAEIVIKLNKPEKSNSTSRKSVSGTIKKKPLNRSNPSTLTSTSTPQKGVKGIISITVVQCRNPYVTETVQKQTIGGKIKLGTRSPQVKEYKENTPVVFEVKKLRELINIKREGGGQLSFTVEPQVQSSLFADASGEGWVSFQRDPGPYYDLPLQSLPEFGDVYIRWGIKVIHKNYYELPVGRDIENMHPFSTLCQGRLASSRGHITPKRSQVSLRVVSLLFNNSNIKSDEVAIQSSYDEQLPRNIPVGVSCTFPAAPSASDLQLTFLQNDQLVGSSVLNISSHKSGELPIMSYGEQVGTAVVTCGVQNSTNIPAVRKQPAVDRLSPPAPNRVVAAAPPVRKAVRKQPIARSPPRVESATNRRVEIVSRTHPTTSTADRVAVPRSASPTRTPRGVGRNTSPNMRTKLNTSPVRERTVGRDAELHTNSVIGRSKRSDRQQPVERFTNPTYEQPQREQHQAWGDESPSGRQNNSSRYPGGEISAKEMARREKTANERHSTLRQHPQLTSPSTTNHNLSGLTAKEFTRRGNRDDHVWHSPDDYSPQEDHRVLNDHIVNRGMGYPQPTAEETWRTDYQNILREERERMLVEKVQTEQDMATAYNTRFNDEQARLRRELHSEGDRYNSELVSLKGQLSEADHEKVSLKTLIKSLQQQLHESLMRNTELENQLLVANNSLQSSELTTNRQRDTINELQHDLCASAEYLASIATQLPD